MIELENITFGYDREQPVIHSVTGCAAPGRVLALVGPNAAGKSTLLRLMLGQLQPQAGEVRLEAKPIESYSVAERARRLAYVPQRAATSFSFSVAEVVEMGRYALPRDGRAVTQAIEDCDLVDLAARPYHELSVGQQQRVLLARALAQSHGGGRALLLDEPGSALDLRHAQSLMRKVRDVAQRGLAVVVVLHDLSLAAAFADDAWVLDAGRLVAAGTWESVLRPDVLEPVFGVPLRLLEARPGERPLLVPDPAGTLDRPSTQAPRHAGTQGASPA